MSLAVVRSRAPAPGRAPEVTVEVHLANGLPSFSIVGLPDLLKSAKVASASVPRYRTAVSIFPSAVFYDANRRF